jgi:hypothetical protein
MDNRLKFLYLIKTEMWGRREKAEAGNGKTGASVIPVREAKPSGKGKT